MRFYHLVLCGILFISLQKLSAQESGTGPILEEFGSVFSIPEPDLLLDSEKNHKILFDIYTDLGGESKINPLLNTVARFLNMHGQTGLSRDKMQVVVIMHGAGAKNALNEEAYRKKFGRSNPNADLLKALDGVGVDLYICGQSLYSRGFSPDDLAEPVKLSLSAMTALVHFQAGGYQLINFN
jgi:intracellular sulfur oxidation DsrE/DsrF family protein